MKSPATRLYKIAEAQQGYFTTSQAVAVGYPTANHGRQCRSGFWVREYRGIYRLVMYPASPEGQYVLWSLWSRNRAGEVQGVYSHETALSLFDLSDVMPARLHMTVPKTFRRSVPIPPVLVLHYLDIESDEIEQRQGYSLTRPLRAIADLFFEGTTNPEQLRLALTQAMDRGLVTRREFLAHPARLVLDSLIQRRTS